MELVAFDWYSQLTVGIEWLEKLPQVSEESSGLVDEGNTEELGTGDKKSETTFAEYLHREDDFEERAVWGIILAV